MRRGSVVALSVFMVVLDQLSKHWARNTLVQGEAIPFVPGLLQLTLVRNTGAAFSLFRESSLLLGLLSFAVAVAVREVEKTASRGGRS